MTDQTRQRQHQLRDAIIDALVASYIHGAKAHGVESNPEVAAAAAEDSKQATHKMWALVYGNPPLLEDVEP